MPAATPWPHSHPLRPPPSRPRPQITRLVERGHGARGGRLCVCLEFRQPVARAPRTAAAGVAGEQHEHGPGSPALRPKRRYQVGRAGGRVGGWGGAGELARSRPTPPPPHPSVCGNFAIVGTNSGTIYKYNLQSGQPRGSFPKNASRRKRALAGNNKAGSGSVKITAKKLKKALGGGRPPFCFGKAAQARQT